MSLSSLIPAAIKSRIRTWQYQRQAQAVLRSYAAAVPQKTALPKLDIALVIPVWNDAERLQRLLQQAQDMGCFAQIVVIDDGSATPVFVENVTLIRHKTPQGAGPARNAGLAAVTTSHLLYFDSDDLLTAELPDLLADLAEQDAPFDFCLFKHADSRTMNAGHWGQPDWDETFWQAADLSHGTLRDAPARSLPLLAQTANYPWNKVYRTAFLRENQIRCADTPVHEDITLHWLGFLAAARVLTSDRVCAWHQVSATGGRQTNRTGAERLQVFAAFEPVMQAAQTRDDPAFQAAFVHFALGLFDWIFDNLDPEQHDAMDTAIKAWLTGPIAAWRPKMAAIDPIIDDAISARLAA